MNKQIRELKNFKLGIRVVCYLLKDGKVLLGKRKEGMGTGNYVGIGGKLEGGETEVDAVIREMQEEISVTPIEFERKGSVKFFFPEKEKWNQEVVLFTCTKWEGEPTESEEIIPEWFNVSSLPYEGMWDDAPLWIPKVLNGESINGIFVYDETNSKVKEYELS